VAQPDHPLAAARRLARHQFISQFPEPLLVGDRVHELHSDTPGPTPQISWNETEISSKFGAAQLAMLVCALRKVQKNFPRMITVGRTSNSDIVIPHDSVSKMHAFFQRLEGGNSFGLTDAGSTNGTFVNDVRLVAHAAPTPVPPGANVRFGRIALIVRDAAAFWDSLR
jgi:hypothetical protein